MISTGLHGHLRLEITPLPIKNVFFGFVSIGNKIYVMSGTVGGNPCLGTYSNVYEEEIIQR